MKYRKSSFMQKYLVCFFAIIVLNMISSPAFSVPANPIPFKFRQPDNTEIMIRLKGDERISWAETMDGYSLVRNQSDGWEIARKNKNGDLESSGILAHEQIDRKQKEKDFLGSIPKQMGYSKKQVENMSRYFDLQLKSGMNVNAFVPLGSKKLLMILINFSDKSFIHTNETFNNLMNQKGFNQHGAIGSVNDYYAETSYNQFDINTTVVGPYTAKNTLDYYGTNTPSKDYRINELIIEALNLANPDVNYADYDNDNDGSVDGVYVVYAGFGEASGAPANTIWPKAGGISTQKMDGKSIKNYSCSGELRGNSGTNLTTIGVICHEFGHVCGARDYYDIDYETGGSFTGTGNWDLMAGGTYNGSPGGSCPSHFNPKVKVDFNWVKPVILLSNTTLSIPDITTNKSIYIYNTATPNEMFFLENRQKKGFNSAVPGHGLMIYHYSKSYFDNGSYRNQTHPQGFYPVCASATSNPGSTSSSYGSINSSGCPFPGKSMKTAFTDNTVPNSKSWNGISTNSDINNIIEIADLINLCFKGCTNPLPPEEFSATAKSMSQIDLKWRKNKANNNVLVAWSTKSQSGSPVSGESYSPGSLLPGGGIVIYNGSATLFNHQGLKPDTANYYKIWSIDSLNRYSFDLPATTESTFSHVWSGAVSSDWFNTGNWANGSLPLPASNVIIPSAPVNQPQINSSGALCNHVLIESGAILTLSSSGSYSFTVFGNWTNNGTFNPGTGTVEFKGNNPLQTIAGASSTPFYILKVEKTTPDRILEIVSPITLTATVNPLVLKSGTFKLSSASILSPFTSGTGATITNGAGFWLNGGIINSGNFNWTLNGTGNGAELKITDGILNIGTNTGNSLIYLNNPSIIVEDGKINIAARIQPNSSTSFARYVQTGGTVTVFTQGSTSTTLAPIDFTGNMNFTMSGGTIAIQKASSHTTSDVVLASATNNITGGTFQFGNEETPEKQTFRIASSVPIYNLEVNSPNSTVRIVNKGITVLNNLIVNKGKFVVDPGKQLSVFNLLANKTESAGGFRIRSDSTGTGSVICPESSGLAIAEIYSRKEQSQLISPSVSEQTISGFLSDNENISDISPLKKKMTDFNPLLSSWNEYFEKSNSGNLKAGKGYVAGTSVNSQILITGSINTKDLAIPVQRGTWNLTGNPYSSNLGISGSSMAVKNFIDHNLKNIDSSYLAVYLWNKMDSANGFQGKYSILSKTSSAIKEIPMGQAFFVKTSSKSDSLFFSTDMRTHSTASGSKPEELLLPEIEIIALNNRTTSSTRILLSNAMSTGLDPGYDVGVFKMTGENAIYTRLVKDNGVDFAMQYIPLDDCESFIIPIGFESQKGGEIEFSVKTLSMPQGINLFLEDRQNEIIKPFISGESYKTNVVAGSKATGRFFLRFKPAVTNLISNRLNNQIKAFIENNSIVITGIEDFNSQVDLYDITGRLMLTKNLVNTGSERINFSGIRPGIYILRISGKSGIKGLKIRI